MKRVSPLSQSQGPSAPDFEFVVREAMRDELSWSLLVADPDAAYRAYLLLTQWKRDIKHQRTIKAAIRANGEITHREHLAWLARSAGFERYVDRRLAELGTPSSRQGKPKPPSIPPDPSVTRRLRMQHKRDIRLIDELARTIQKFEAGEITTAGLFAALDAEIELGKQGVMSVREALDRGLIPHRLPDAAIDEEN